APDISLLWIQLFTQRWIRRLKRTPLRGHLLDVAARAKDATGAGEDQHARLRIALDAVQLANHLLVHFPVDRVLGVRIVDRDGDDAVRILLRNNESVAHGGPVRGNYRCRW